MVLLVFAMEQKRKVLGFRTAWQGGRAEAPGGSMASATQWNQEPLWLCYPAGTPSWAGRALQACTPPWLEISVTDVTFPYGCVRGPQPLLLPAGRVSLSA